MYNTYCCSTATTIGLMRLHAALQYNSCPSPTDYSNCQAKVTPWNENPLQTSVRVSCEFRQHGLAVMRLTYRWTLYHANYWHVRVGCNAILANSVTVWCQTSSINHIILSMRFSPTPDLTTTQRSRCRRTECSSTANLDTLSFLWNLKVHYRVHNSPRLLSITWARWMQSTVSQPIPWRPVLILSSYRRPFSQ